MLVNEIAYGREAIASASVVPGERDHPVESEGSDEDRTKRLSPSRAMAGVAGCDGHSGHPCSPSQGTTGPNQVSIASTGGYNACLTGIADGDEFAVFRSIQGTRHPYQGASYTINNSVIGVTPQIGNDSSYYIYEGAPVMKIMRVDNQAASSGNGLYECKAIP